MINLSLTRLRIMRILYVGVSSTLFVCVVPLYILYVGVVDYVHHAVEAFQIRIGQAVYSLEYYFVLLKYMTYKQDSC